MALIRRYSKLFKALHFIGDLFLLNIALYLAVNTRFDDDYPFWFQDKYIVLYVMFNIVWILLASILNIYEFYRVVNVSRVIKNLIKAVLLHLVLIAIFIVSLKWYYFSREFLFYAYLYLGILVVLFRSAFLIFILRMRTAGRNTRTAVIVGAGPVGIETYELLVNHPEYGFNFLGFFDDNGAAEEHDLKILGKVSELEEFSKENKIDEIFCALPLASTEKIRSLMTFADNNLIRFKIVPDFRGFYNHKVSLEFYDDLPVLLRRSEPLENAYNIFAKRSFDILFSLFIIIFILSWITPILAILIRLTSKGPIFFKQKRSGKVNQEFWCLKFRTMHINNGSDERQATLDDSRVTPIGRILRKTSLDELPQFFNVLIGNMSVVGPRPHMLKHTEEYSQIIDKFMVRHFVTPGITGLAQVRGYRGQTKDSEQMYRRVRTDVWYIENWSFLLDLQIIFQTVLNGFKGDKMAY